MRPGVVVALVTPLNPDETIDVEGLDNLLEWIIQGGVRGVFLGGTMGEGLALRQSERESLFAESVRIVDGRIPVLANVSETGSLRSVDLARIAESAGVDVTVVTARPAFLPRRREETLLHVQAILNVVSRPVWYYENPVTTGVTSTFAEIKAIVSLPGVTGLKFSAADRDLFERCVRQLPDGFPVLTGNVQDIAFAGALGAWGAVSGIGSLLPGLCERIYRAARAGDTDEARRLQTAVTRVYDIYGGEGWPLWPAAQKHALKSRGLIRCSTVTAPFTRLAAKEEAAVDAVLARLDPDLFAPAG